MNHSFACSGLTPGGGTDLLKGMETAFSFTDVQAVSYVSDGKAELGESLAMFFFLTPSSNGCFLIVIVFLMVF